MFRLVTSCAPVAGFAVLLLALLYLMYAYLTARSFNACLQFLLRCGVVAFVGYFAACNGFTALALHDLANERDFPVPRLRRKPQVGIKVP